MTDIQHQPEESRFILEEDGEIAKLSYQLTDGTVTFTHTFVPPELRGGGRAKRLVESGLNWAKERELEIKSSCWYVDRFL